MGGVLAAARQAINWPVLSLTVLTALLLQILSNIANDLGDSRHGADKTGRQGPQRMVQAGKIPEAAMRKAMYILAILSTVSGIWLLLAAQLTATGFFILIGLGLFAVIAAVLYTNGSKPYGYMGLGDISVFLFFGLLAVLGTYYLQTGTVDWSVVLPAMSCGFFTVAVLNINNIRDIESDRRAGKKSIPVRLGRARAALYHCILLAGGLGSALIYVLINYTGMPQFLFLLVLPFVVANGKAIQNITEPRDLDPYLKQMAFLNMFFVATFGIGILI